MNSRPKTRLLLLFALSAPGIHAQPSMRTLTGTVTDGHREPLKGAVVQIQDEQTGRVASYLTEVDGTYRFRRLLPDDDYKVWATYRGHKSRTREMSHFDSKPSKVMSLLIKAN